MKKLAILLFMLSGFLVKEDVDAANTQQKSNAESQVTITFVESSEKQGQVERKDSQKMALDRNSKTLLPITGSKMSGLLFILGMWAFFLSATILSMRRKHRRNNL
ncbi:LPXTG cell wall anchor domain-containing protein [Enterococcus faecalis]|uniref:LPXTG cell wall anchor domain-containing protein n=1 Tax=Enterococcus faecalis TaxID=1351 RepID=UPI0020911CFC|nr:LPXTG cell wall anchor domain-containing protein [Enterococcus faecalis]MCO5494526.1 LPXTG cell wall anchor domain-containing protein [Enterococcus faecalis]MCO5500695.1 LPXTG cell wall anchor domain-containing protein [Enterococcus faecalis]